MEKFIEELATVKVLAVEDIILLKDYVANKYEKSSSDQRAKVLSKAVHQILDKNIPQVGNKYGQVIKQELLRKTIIENGSPIHMLDILNECIFIKDESSDYIDNIISWTNSRVKSKVTREAMRSYYVRLNPIEEGIPLSKLVENSSRDVVEDLSSHMKSSESQVAKKVWGNILWKREIGYLVCFILVFTISFSNQHNYKYNLKFNKHQYEEEINIDNSNNALVGLAETKLAIQKLPESFKYKNINRSLLKNFLIKKNSLLAEEPYFSAIISSAKEYGLNPLILFAIAGQEQGFVSKNSFFSKEIANNPFNVYHSWKEYNTNIYDSTSIACVTILNSCSKRPSEIEPFEWINISYAEDRNWAEHVISIFNSLEQNNSKLLKQ